MGDVPASPPRLAPLLVRTWNLFHGNAKPPERTAFLQEMVRLAAADGPDVLCLQEVPVWALERLGEWSGMSAVGAVAARPTLGPLPSTAEIGRVLTSLHHGLLRAAWFVDAVAVPGEPVVLCGDFNVPAARSRTLADLSGPEWGFSAAGKGIDHVLVRGAVAGAAEPWPPERRRVGGRLLSDHAPVEVRIG